MVKVSTKAGVVELPKLTMRLSDMTDEVEGCATNRERFRLQHEFLGEVLPPETLAECLDGDSLEDVDLTELSVLYAAVVNAYAAPAIEEQRRQLAAQVNAVKPALDAIGKVSAASQRQGFRSVR